MRIEFKTVRNRKRNVPEPPALKAGVTDPRRAQIAIANEFGTASIPPRPAFSTAVARVRSEPLPQLRIIDDPELASETMGIHVVELMRYEIDALSSPPNSPETIDKKGSSNPLVDTGELLKSVEYEILD